MTKILTNVLSDVISNRYEGLLIFDCENGNPNGDPDGGNLPRVNPTNGNGWVTDVCQKRFIRDHVFNYYNHNGRNGIHIAKQSDLNVNIAKAYEETGGMPERTKKDEWAHNPDKAEKATRYLCDHFFDIRAFGGVLNTGPRANSITGPIQMSFAESYDPIDQLDISITRCAKSEIEKEELKEFGNPKSSADYEKIQNLRGPNKNQTMGRKQLIPYGLYCSKFFVNPFLAQKTGFNEDDLSVFFKSLQEMFDNNRSATRGYMTTRKLIVFKHVGVNFSNEDENRSERMLGCAPSHVLLENGSVVTVSKKDYVEIPSCYADYDIVIDEDKVPNGVEIMILR